MSKRPEINSVLNDAWWLIKTVLFYEGFLCNVFVWSFVQKGYVTSRLLMIIWDKQKLRLILQLKFAAVKPRILPIEVAVTKDLLFALNLHSW